MMRKAFHFLKELARGVHRMADNLDALTAAVSTLTTTIANLPASTPPVSQQPAIDALTAQVTQATTDLATKFPTP